MMKKNHLINIIKNSRTYIALGHDVIVAVVAWLFAYSVRFNFDIPATHNHEMWLHSYWVIPLEVAAFLGFGLYRGAWRFASIPDLKRILKAVGFSALLVVTVCLILKPFGTIPRSILLLNPILLVVGICGSRIAYRMSKEQALYGKIFTQGKPVIILGAGEAAISLVKELSRSKDWQVVGLVDDDKTILGRQLAGARVLGTLEDLPEIAQKYQVAHAIVAMPSVDHSKRRTAVGNANACGLTVLTVPAFDDLMSGKVSISQIRQVEVEDLLGREPVKLDTLGLHDLIERHAVLVTGAGGSIGSELCRQILKYHPSQLICVDTSEFYLYQIEQEFSQLKLDDKTTIIYVTANVRNDKRMNALLSAYQPQVVYHAAAYKHVPLMENTNVAEALSNNVLGTYAVARACKEAGIAKFVLVSTDKAVNPTNVMGASKRLAEMVCQGLQEKQGTKFVTVRFGNVLGSSGSVIPKFREQIANGGPVTITHPEITRYFMSIPEAAQLVMQAGMMGSGGEIFVLDMGEPVKIVNLAKDMIRLSGLSEDEVDIVYTGLRPGEKLYEELLADDEMTLPTTHEKLRIASARAVDERWVKSLIEWIATTPLKDERLIKEELKNWVQDYQGDINAS